MRETVKCFQILLQMTCFGLIESNRALESRVSISIKLLAVGSREPLSGAPLTLTLTLTLTNKLDGNYLTIWSWCWCWSSLDQKWPSKEEVMQKAIAMPTTRLKASKFSLQFQQVVTTSTPITTKSPVCSTLLCSHLFNIGSLQVADSNVLHGQQHVFVTLRVAHI